MRENQIYGSRAQVAVKVEEWGHEPVASRSWKNSLDADSSLEPREDSCLSHTLILAQRDLFQISGP